MMSLVSSPDERNPYGISVTKRLVVPAAEQLLYQPHSTFGEEQITLVDYMGGDKEVERVATAGHMSTIFPEQPDPADFLEHLAANGITVPFKAVQLKFSIQCSIADALHIVYAKAASVNEYSGRYSVLLDSSFLPTAEYLMARMRGVPTSLAADKAKNAADLIAEGRTANYEAYQQLVSADIDLARELARAPVELNNDTKFFWKIELDDLQEFISRKRLLKGRHGPQTLYAYLDFMEEAAKAVAPDSWVGLHDGWRELRLTMPKAEEIIDPLPLPAPWKAEETRRVTVPALEELLYVPQPYLEHGKVQAVSYMGDNSGPAESARISYGSGTKRLQEDRHLLRYLRRHQHTTPFEHVEVAVEGKTPLFIDPRQAGRHRTLDHHCFMGEILLGSQYFIPPASELKYQDRKNRQGRGKELDEELKSVVLESLSQSYERENKLTVQLRERQVNEEDIQRTKGVGFYTFIWRTGDLHNWCHFLGLRLDAHAQKEIRDYAEICAKAVQAVSPDTVEALRDYQLDALRFSSRELPALAKLLDTDKIGTIIDDLGFYQQHKLVTTRNDAEGKEIKLLNREGEELQQKLRRLLALREG